MLPFQGLFHPRSRWLTIQQRIIKQENKKKIKASPEQDRQNTGNFKISIHKSLFGPVPKRLSMLVGIENRQLKFKSCNLLH